MRYIVNFVVAILMLLVVGCSGEQFAEVVTSREVILYANDVVKSTRTTFSYDDELGRCVTSWEAGDVMSVLLAADGVETKSYLFKLQDASLGSFRSDDVEDGGDALYDAYAVYPSTATINVEDCTALVQVGAKEQKMTGNQPTHIAACDPLWGTQTQVGLDDIRLQMHHSAAVMQFSVQNTTGEDLVVSSVMLYAPTTIAGLYALSLHTGELELQEGDESVSKSVELTIEDGTLSNEEVFTAWVAMAPFAVSVGDELIFIVKTSDGRMYSYEKSFEQEVSFPAGKVMEMSAPIKLSPSTLMAESIDVKFDCADETAYPSDFPTTKVVTEGVIDYLLGGYPFSIYCTQPYMYRSGMLRFYFNNSGKIEQNDCALIYFPYYEGYKLNEVRLSLEATNVYKFRVAIVNPDNAGGVLYSKNPTSNPTYNADVMTQMGADLSEQCGLYLYFEEASDKITAYYNCFIKKINLNYVLDN